MSAQRYALKSPPDSDSPLRPRQARRGGDLQSKGVRFQEYTEGPLQTTGSIAQLGPNRGAWFSDPDGSTLGLVQVADS